MTINFELTGWAVLFGIFFAALVVFILLQIFFKRFIKRRNVRRISIAGVLGCLVLSGGVFFYVTYQGWTEIPEKQDWAIPECRDQNGDLITEDPRCQYP